MMRALLCFIHCDGGKDLGRQAAKQVAFHRRTQAHEGSAKQRDSNGQQEARGKGCPWVAADESELI